MNVIIYETLRRVISAQVEDNFVFFEENVNIPSSISRLFFVFSSFQVRSKFDES